MLALAQTTQGLVSGRVVDSRTGNAVGSARIVCSQESTGTRVEATSDSQGYFALPLLPPGFYTVRATAASYQSQEAQNLELAVAGRLDINFRLRPLTDVWEAGLYRSVFLPGGQTVVTFYGPDVDTSHSGNFEGLRGDQGALESTVSYVIDPVELENLPLAGRDAYSLLFTLPAVTSDDGVSRGLDLSINGQRPSSSNYLLDGVENNNYLITGPLTPIAPEAIQEYRVSVSNFSAQYGGTSGFVANAVTRSGTDVWHGIGYIYFRNAGLDANTFQRNLSGIGRPLDGEVRPGFQVGGPLLHQKLYLSGSFEHFAGRQREDPQTFWLPTPALAAALPSGSPGQKLLTAYPSPLPAQSSGGACGLASPTGCYSSVTLEPPISLNQSVGLVRLDYIPPGGAHHVTARLATTQLGRPDFLWSPYPSFTTPFNQTDLASMVSDQYAITPHITNEARISLNIDELGWGAVNQVPTLNVGVVTSQGLMPLSLPGSSPVYPYANNDHSIEGLDNLVWTHGRHVITVGGSFLLRNVGGFDAYEGNGAYNFGTFTRFFRQTPAGVSLPIDRSDLSNPTLPSWQSGYSDRQFSLFAQGSFRATSHLLLNYGVRVEYFGAPHDTGSSRDPILELGSGSNLTDALQSGTLNFSGGPGGALFQPRNPNWAPRFGFSYQPFENGKTILHGGYGIFYDRLFDNLWETVRANGVDFAQINFRGGAQIDFTQPIAQVLPSYVAANYTTILSSVPNLTMFQPNLHSGYAQDMFLGVQHMVTPNLLIDVNGMSALGRRLITNDTLGYNTLFDGSQPGIPAGQLVTYRGSQGLSDYYALALRVRYRHGRSLVQAAYTWSHSIDNQSDPLGLDLSSFGFTSGLPPVPAQYVAGFAQPGDSNGDRGNSDFDERQNLVVQATYALPSFHAQRFLSTVTSGWTVTGVGAIRSGFPYTVYGFGGLSGFARANIVDPSQTLENVPSAGGVYLLNAAGFDNPGGMGEPSGRNAFTGPGLYNLDLGVSRSFGLRWLPESSRLIFRADFYNVLNHANLNNPDPVFFSGSDTFGLATYGRTGIPVGFPTPLPLAETPRQIEVSMHLQF